MKKMLRFLIWFLIGIILLFLVFLLVSTFTDFKPDERELVYQAENPDQIPMWTEYDLMIWNIGYCGLDAGMDFFYDGGEQVRPEKEQVKANLDFVTSFLASNDSIEFFLLQEVDKSSKRSYKIHLYDSIHESLSGYHSFFGVNYKVGFVPLPPSGPMGKVESGLQSLSKFQPSEVVRHSFPGNYSWPMGVFMLDRCFLVKRYALQDGKEFVLVNTHNSAYDDGSLKAVQMEFMKGFLNDEFLKGNYIVVGGDWNQSPPGFEGVFEGQVFDSVNFTRLEENYPAPGWNWVWEASVPTNRRVATTYSRGETPTALIDFFLVSPNVEVVQVKNIDLDFRHSDHQPVIMKFRLSRDK